MKRKILLIIALSYSGLHGMENNPGSLNYFFRMLGQGIGTGIGSGTKWAFGKKEVRERKEMRKIIDELKTDYIKKDNPEALMNLEETLARNPNLMSDPNADIIGALMINNLKRQGIDNPEEYMRKTTEEALNDDDDDDFWNVDNDDSNSFEKVNDDDFVFGKDKDPSYKKFKHPFYATIASFYDEIRKEKDPNHSNDLKEQLNFTLRSITKDTNQETKDIYDKQIQVMARNLDRAMNGKVPTTEKEKRKYKEKKEIIKKSSFKKLQESTEIPGNSFDFLVRSAEIAATKQPQ